MSQYEKEFNYMDQGYFPGDRPVQRESECWAEVGSSVAEAKYVKEGGSFGDTRPSIQHLVDCKHCDASGDFGGHMDRVWFFMEHFGVAITADYPRSRFGPVRGECLECDGSVKPKLAIDGFKKINVEKYEIMKALHDEGPLAVCLWIDTKAWNAYKGGITDVGVLSGPPSDKSVKAGKHYVTLVGYRHEDDDEEDMQYWILKNSAGPKWGDKGLMRLRMVKTDCFCEITTPIRPHRIDKTPEEEAANKKRKEENKKRKEASGGGSGGGVKVKDKRKKEAQGKKLKDSGGGKKK